MLISFRGLCDDSQYGKLILILTVSTALWRLTILKPWEKGNWFVFCRYTFRSRPSDTRHAAPLPARGCKEGKANENSSSKVSSNSYKQYVNTMCLSIRKHGHSGQALSLRVFSYKNKKINCPCSRQEFLTSAVAGVNWLILHVGCFTPAKQPRVHWIANCMCPTGGLDILENQKSLIFA